MNTAVIVVIAILVIGAITGIRRGFIKTVFTLFSTIAAILLTILLSPYVCKMLAANDTVMNYVTERVTEQIAPEETAGEEDESFIEELGLPAFMEKALLENNTDDIYEVFEVEAQNVQRYVIMYVSMIILRAISFILTFIMMMILLWLLCKLLDIVAKLPVLHGINKFLGLAAGLVQGVVIVWLLCVVVTAISSTQLGMDIFEMIDESEFLTFIYDHNLITGFVNSILK